MPVSSRVAPARCRAEAPSEPCVPLVVAHGSSKPRGSCGLKCGFPALLGLLSPQFTSHHRRLRPSPPPPPGPHVTPRPVKNPRGTTHSRQPPPPPPDAT